MSLHDEGGLAAEHPPLLLQPVLQGSEVWEQRGLGRADVRLGGAAGPSGGRAPKILRRCRLPAEEEREQHKQDV